MNAVVGLPIPETIRVVVTRHAAERLVQRFGLPYSLADARKVVRVLVESGVCLPTRTMGKYFRLRCGMIGARFVYSAAIGGMFVCRVDRCEGEWTVATVYPAKPVARYRHLFEGE